jgi:hypothetical protein
MLYIQLAKREEVDSRMGFVVPTDFDYDDIDGVNEVVITIDPVTAGTSVVFSAFLSDKSHPVLGLAVADLLYTKNGVAAVPSAITYSGNKATLTVAALIASDIVTLGFKNATYPTSGIYQDSSGVSYRASTETAVVS